MRKFRIGVCVLLALLCLHVLAPEFLVVPASAANSPTSTDTVTPTSTPTALPTSAPRYPFIEPEYYPDYDEDAGDAEPSNLYIVTARALNVRLAPSLDGERIGLLYRGDIVRVLDIENGWALIATLDDSPAYAHTAYLEAL